MTITATGRFLPTDGLSLPFSRIKAQPWRALRLVACDVAVLGTVSALAAYVGPLGGMPAGTPDGMILLAGAGALAYVFWAVASFAAWIRYLAGRERPGPFPHRFGADELRLVGLYLIALIIGFVFVIMLAVPGFVLDVAWGRGGTGLWSLVIVATLAWFFARFAPLPARVLLTGRLEPLTFWEETRPMRGRLRWALACLFLATVVVGFFVGMTGALTGQTRDISVSLPGMGAWEQVRLVFETGFAPGTTAMALAALTGASLCRLMLRGVAVQAALVIEAGGEDETATDAVPGGAPAPAGG